MSERKTHDVVVVGGGFAGAILAKELTFAGLTVLLLEAGTDDSLGPENYAARVQTYYAAAAKVPDSAYPATKQAPQADVLDLPASRVPGPPWTKGYLVQLGPQPFGSDYVRSLGGTSLHWLGESLRMCPNDFHTRKIYGQGVDWPITYEDLEPYYCRAEEELGVAANVKDQEVGGIWFRPGYAFPMKRIPLSYSDEYLRHRLAGFTIEIEGKRYPTDVGSTPVSRNSDPDPRFVSARKGRAKNGLLPSYQPLGMVGDPLEGQRCQGNSSCIPICPVQAKYVSLKTLEGADRKLLTVVTQAVASKVVLAESGKKVKELRYLRYDKSGKVEEKAAVGKIYVLACNAIENAKLLLLSDFPDESGQLGRNLMDHPYPLVWASLADTVGTFRGPGSSSGIDTMRDGPFRSELAAFRVTISNWGWNFAAGSPVSDVRDLVTPATTRRVYSTPRGRALSAAVSSANATGLFGRALRRALFDRVNRQLQMGMLVEQDPVATNRVSLAKQKDALGLPRPQIDYDLSDYVKRGIATSVRAARQMFGRLSAKDETSYAEDDAQSFWFEGQHYAWRGAGHLMGTHRMGRSARDSVVDADGRCWKQKNLFLAGAGNMPTVGTSNPTLTLSALAFRTADAIVDELKVFPMSAPEPLRFGHPKHAADLLATPPAKAKIEDVRRLLQSALEVERFTLPPYLTALYSIAEATNVPSVSLLRGVVVQEMLHMSLVCNVLNAIGGAPEVAARQHLSYPAKLPYSGDKFKVGIFPFTPEAIETFCLVEQPGEGAHGVGYHELAQFYRYIERALAALDERTRGGVFRGDPARQVGPEHYYSAGGMLVPVTNLASARAALELVIVQGEGTAESVGGGDARFGQAFQPAHYYAFDSIRKGRLYVAGDSPKGPPTGPEIAVDWEGVAKMRPNLTLSALADWPEIREQAKAFNDAWIELLVGLDVAFNGHPRQLKEGVAKMFALKYQAQALMRLPLDDGEVAGPVWNVK